MRKLAQIKYVRTHANGQLLPLSRRLTPRERQRREERLWRRYVAQKAQEIVE